MKTYKKPEVKIVKIHQDVITSSLIDAGNGDPNELPTVKAEGWTNFSNNLGK